MSKPMTNYNKRLDEILHTAKVNWKTSPDEIFDKGVTAYAKQAITSLIKELVAEAKPEKHIHHHAHGKPFEDAQDIAYNAAIDEFEQNLLKALEEK